MKRNDLGRDPIIPLVFKLAIPACLGQLVNVLYTIVDRMFIGQIPVIGDLALAGAGLCNPITTFLSSFGTLIGIGGSILMAMKMGEKKKEEAQQILSNSFFLLCCISLFLTLIFLLLKVPMLKTFGASETTLPFANTYLSIYTAGTFFAICALGLNSFITAQGHAVTGMLCISTGAVTNIILDYVMIFRWNLGVAGAAYATVISQIAAFTLSFCFLISRRPVIRITRQKLSGSLMLRIVSIGLSPFLILATDSLIIILMNTFLQKYGGPQLGDALIGCATIVQSWLSLITGPMLGITGGTQAIISYNYGACQCHRIRNAERTIVGFCLAFTTMMFILSRCASAPFVRMFTSQPEQIERSLWAIRVFTLGIIPLSLQYAFVDCLTALGRVKTALSLSLTRKGIYTLATILLPIFFGAQNLFFNEPIADFTASTISTIVFLCVFEKHLQHRQQLRYEANKPL